MLSIKNEKEMTVDNPCLDEFYEYFCRTVETTAQIYEEVFNTLPTNQIRNFVATGNYTEKSKLRDTDPLTVC
ncbi:unnamed protein product [Rotaria sordida]|uniref:Uncharacterized protein n=1 Tax=Rotaria sordida TaxID=392033 RepID=A0A819V116_9BILA|nr:unnamed protein product [Rotaria sordida]CAF4090368.1 unnamed protein product [Rotaria sordida]